MVFCFVSSLYLCWLLSAKLDFLYPVWYKQLNIEQLIQKTGPRHRYKKNFHLTQPEEHFRIFARINHAVHHDVKQLSTIAYHNMNGEKIDFFLRKAEITHLIDVANLIQILNTMGLGSIVLFIATGLTILLRKIRFPGVLKLGMATAGASLVISTCIILIGPVELFYLLHHWVFPENNQWFFYYEDSLMTLMMHAPYLFGYISLMLLIGSLTITAILICIYNYIYNRYCTKK